MPTPTYTLLNQTVLTNDTTTELFFLDIPQGYRDLVLVVDAVNGTATNTRLRFNGDTGGNYSRVQLSGDSVSVTTGTTASDSTYMLTSGTSGRYLSILHIFDYSATDKHKPGVGRLNFSGDVSMRALRWANLAAITSMRIYISTSWGIGSSFYLYGISG